MLLFKKNNEKENSIWEEAIMDTLGSGWWGRWAISEGAKKNPNISDKNINIWHVS